MLLPALSELRSLRGTRGDRLPRRPGSPGAGYSSSPRQLSPHPGLWVLPFVGGQGRFVKLWTILQPASLWIEPIGVPPSGRGFRTPPRHALRGSSSGFPGRAPRDWRSRARSRLLPAPRRVNGRGRRIGRRRADQSRPPVGVLVILGEETWRRRGQQLSPLSPASSHKCGRSARLAS